MLESARYWFILFTVISLVGSVSASLYPTSPVSQTVWSAGRSHNITWIEDGKSPKLKDMSNIRIELFVAGNVGFRKGGIFPFSKCLV